MATGNVARFSVPGEPVGKGRPRMTKSGHAYTPEKTAVYENLVKVEFQRQCPGYFIAEGPVRLRIVCRFPLAKSDSQKKRAAKLSGAIRPTKKPDIDNCIKAIADALNGLAYTDDTQIVTVYAAKWYSEIPGVEVTIMDEGGGVP